MSGRFYYFLPDLGEGVRFMDKPTKPDEVVPDEVLDMDQLDDVSGGGLVVGTLSTTGSTADKNANNGEGW